jgi:hypothetical protein
VMQARASPVVVSAQQFRDLVSAVLHHLGPLAGNQFLNSLNRNMS